jgi:Uri superfamily endonuclease
MSLKGDNILIPKLSTSGIYTLILFLPKEIELNIGKLGKKRFSAGYYTYTGSALGKGATSLKNRIARHLRKEKRKFWHIDYLLENESVSIEVVFAAETSEDIECNINNYITKIRGAKIQVHGFGASDCRKNCGSHLLYFPEVKKADFLGQKLVELFQSSSGILSVCIIRQYFFGDLFS